MSIRYKAYTTDGRRVEGVLPVTSPTMAEEILWQSNLTVTSLREETNRRRNFRMALVRSVPSVFGVKPVEVVAFSRELIVLLSAGIPLRDALILLQERQLHPQLKETLDKIVIDLESGTSLSQAVSKYPTVFPDIYARLLLVGEETGHLAEALDEVARYMEQQYTISARASKALRYPLMILVMGLGASVYMIGFTLPALTGLLTEFGGELPLAPRIMIAIGDAARAYGLQTLALFGAAGVGLGAYFRTEKGKDRRDTLVLRLPLLGPMLHTIAMFRFMSSLTAMVKSGLPLLEALRMTSRVVGNRAVARAIDTVNTQVVQGVAFSRAMKEQAIFPALVTQLIGVGEQAGNLPRQLQTISDALAQETQKRIATLTGMIEPAMTMIMGAVVGFMAIAVLSAVYGTLGQIR